MLISIRLHIVSNSYFYLYIYLYFQSQFFFLHLLSLSTIVGCEFVRKKKPDELMKPYSSLFKVQ